MGKILGSWSGMRKYLEDEMLAESLHGRVRYGCTTYIGMDGSHIFEVCVDGKQLKRFSLETVNTFFINSGLKENTRPFGIREYWDEFWMVYSNSPMQRRTEYTDDEFCDALENYRNQSIRESLNSENALVRMFAILDRRVGKRMLIEIKKTIERQPK